MRCRRRGRARARREDARRGAGQPLGQPVDRHRQQQDKQQLYNVDGNPEARVALQPAVDVGNVPSATRWSYPVTAKAIGAPNTIRIRPGWARRSVMPMTWIEPATSP